jgi:hypothetical protein
MMEYRGGTYISQVKARSVDYVLLLWAKSLDPHPIAGFGERRKQELIAAVQEDENDLVPLSGLKNAWCASALISSRLALINVVATVSRR